MPIVHGVSPSPFVRKVRVFLAEKGIDYELDPVPPFPPANATPEFRRLSPLGKIPVWQDGDFALPDSSVICAYLERIHPEPALYPSEPKAYGRALWFEEYADTALSEALGTVFFQRVINPRVFKQDPDQDLVKEQLTSAIPPFFDYLEEQLSGGESILEGGLSIADISLCTQIQQLRHAGETIDAARWPKLARWSDAVLSRASFQSCIEDERKLLSSM
jgi:glutathione S-transferase